MKTGTSQSPTCKPTWGELMTSPCTARWIKKKLSQHYGESIVIGNMKDARILFILETVQIIYSMNFTEGQNKDIVSEKERVIKLAANLIKNHIKALDCNKNHYFSFSELYSNTITVCS